MHFHHPLLQVKHLFNLFILLVSLLSTMTSSAHEIRPSIVDISFTKNGSYKMSIKTNLEAMLAEIGAEHTDTSNSNNAQRYNNLRKMPFNTLIQEFSTFEANLIEKIQLNFNGSPQKISVESVDIPDIGDIELARDSTINFVGTMPDNTINLSWKWDASFGNAILRVSSDKQPELYSNYLTGGELSIRIPVSGIKAPSKWEQFKNYIQIGFVHIIPKGLDHILFVIGLFLLSTQLRPLLIQITSFTLAHSVTLALGIYGIVIYPLQSSNLSLLHLLFMWQLKISTQTNSADYGLSLFLYLDYYMASALRVSYKILDLHPLILSLVSLHSILV